MTSAKYASDAATRMIQALEESDHLRAPAIAAALRIGCHTLGLLVRDLQPGFPLYEDLKRLSALKREHRYEIERATESIETFSKTFLFIEERALIESGASSKLVRFLFSDVQELRNVLRGDDFSIDTVQRRLEDLEASVCEAKRDVQSRLDAEERSSELARVVERGALGIGGAAIVAFNLSTDAVTTFGLLPWMTALSGALGSTLIGKAAGD